MKEKFTKGLPYLLFFGIPALKAAVIQESGLTSLFRDGRAWLALILALGLGASACQQPVDPLQKAFDAIGGKDALLAHEGFSFEATGDCYEPEQGVRPEETIRSSTFTLALLYDVDGEKVSLDWQRQILDPLRGSVEYRDVVDGGVGYQTGRGNVFLPPDAKTDGPLPPMRVGAIRREVRILNPHLYLRALAEDEDMATVKPDADYRGRTHHVIEVRDPVEPVELFVDAETGRLAKLETRQNDHIWGDVVTEVTFDQWASPEGSDLAFPHQVDLIVDGKTLRSETRTSLVVNPDFASGVFDIPDDARTQPDPAATRLGGVNWLYIARWHALGLPFGDREQAVVVSEEVLGDPDVHHLTGAFHHSLALKVGDGVVVLEAPLNEARSKAVLAKIEELWPGVPVTHLIVTHHHFDHLGGFRTYAAAGATIVISELNRSYLERALVSPHTLAPDDLENVADPGWSLEAVPVDGEFSLRDGSHSLKARHVQTVHSHDMLVLYLPESQLVFTSDLYHAGLLPPDNPMPEPFKTWAKGLRDGLATLGWEPRWIAGGHGASPGLGGVRPISDLHSHTRD